MVPAGETFPGRSGAKGLQLSLGRMPDKWCRPGKHSPADMFFAGYSEKGERFHLPMICNRATATLP